MGWEWVWDWGRVGAGDDGEWVSFSLRERIVLGVVVVGEERGVLMSCRLLIGFRGWRRLDGGFLVVEEGLLKEVAGEEGVRSNCKGEAGAC